MSTDLSVRIGTHCMPGPVGLASGTFGYGAEYETLAHLDCLGALYTKAVTPEPRTGNPVPRITETPSGMLNSIGLANPGVEYFLNVTVPALKNLCCSVIVNVAGAVESDYLRVIERIEEAVPQTPGDVLPLGMPCGQKLASTSRSGIDGYEINVSCPNVHQGGLAFGTDPVIIESLTRKLRALTRRPIIVKLTPVVTDITSIALAAEQGGADAVSCINTLIGMVIDPKSRKPVLPRGTGGLSGPAIRPVGVACVYKVARAVSIPVIGLGGIMEPEDAIQYILAGASAVQVGTGTFVDPGTALRVHTGLKTWLETEGFASLKEAATCMR